MTKVKFGARLFVVEDEPLIRQEICVSLEEQGYEILGSSDNADHGLKEITRLKPDLVLLDIRISGNKSGIWLAHQINKTMRTPVVFVTSYSDVSTLEKAKKEHPYGYILKPFKTDDLKATIEISLARHKSDSFTNPPTNEDQVNRKSVFVRTSEGWTNIEIDNIEYLEAYDNYLFLHLINQKRILIRLGLTSFVSKLPESSIIRCHRKYAINLSKIQTINQNNVKLTSKLIPIGNHYKEALFERLVMLS